jgi:hypothetical protein
VDEGLPKSHRGDVGVNPVTGERSVVLVGTGDGRGDRLAAHLHVSPGGAVAGEHYHPSITERFRVLSGQLEVSLDGERRTLPAPRADVDEHLGRLVARGSSRRRSSRRPCSARSRRSAARADTARCTPGGIA